MIHYRAFIAILLIIGVLLPNASSALIGDVAGVAQCSLLNGIVQLIVSRVINKAVSLLNKAIDKAIEFFSFGFISAPEEVKVVNEDQAGVAAKELFKDTISRCIARQILNRMNEGILNLARKMGRDGGPTFVQNWRNFQTNAQYRGEDMFRAILSNTQLCDYFDQNIKGLFNAKTKIPLSGRQNTRTENFDPYTLRANCTLPSNFSMTNYQNDFAGNGGWQAWSRLLEPQNNYYGTLFNSLDEAGKQRTLEQSGDILETQGHGFTSKRGDTANDGCQLRGASGRCIIYNEVETPGGIISELTAETLKSELSWLVSVDELNEVITNMYGVMINRLTDLSGKRKLNEINPPIEGDPGLDDELPNRSPYSNPLPPQEEPPSLPESETRPSSLLSDLQSERGNFGTPMTPAQLATLLNTVAWKNSSNGWGLLSKTGGNNCPFASGPVSCDILFHRPSGLHYDVLIDSENQATPTWNLVGPIDISRWVAPVQP